MADLGNNMNALVLADPGATPSEPSRGPTEATSASTGAPRPAPTRPVLPIITLKAVPASWVLLANPGATPGAEVGTTAWMKTLFPPREGNYTLTFGRDKKHAVSFTVEFLTAHFEFFRACLASPTLENQEKNINLAEVTGDAFAIILAWLLTGAFPRIPEGGSSAAKLITDRLAASLASDFLGLQSAREFILLLENEMRRLLHDDRMALRWSHLETVFSETFPESMKEYVKVFTAAAVKPFLCSWMRDAKLTTIEASVASKYLKEDPKVFKDVIKHYERLMEHLDYQSEVFKQVQLTLRNSKRLNKLPIGDAPATKQLKNLPEVVDHVTYLDPLPLHMSTDSLFTI